MSLVLRSFFSYQVAVGSTMSEYRQVVLMRKSSVTTRSSLPSGALSCHTTSVRLGFVGAEVLALHAVAGAQQVLEEVLVALAARSPGCWSATRTCCAASWPGWSGSSQRHLQRAVLERLRPRTPCRPCRRPAASLHHLHRVGLQLRRRRQPAHALGAHVVVDHAAARRPSCRPAATALLPCRASRSATGRCGRRRSWWSSSAAAGGSSPARRPAPSSRSAAAASPGPRSAPSRRRDWPMQPHIISMLMTPR